MASVRCALGVRREGDRAMSEYVYHCPQVRALSEHQYGRAVPEVRSIPLITMMKTGGKALRSRGSTV